MTLRDIVNLFLPEALELVVERERLSKKSELLTRAQDDMSNRVSQLESQVLALSGGRAPRREAA